MYTIPDDKFIEAVKSSPSIRQVLLKLGMCETGGAYACFHRRVKKLNLDTSHMTGKLWNKGKDSGDKYPMRCAL